MYDKHNSVFLKNILKKYKVTIGHSTFIELKRNRLSKLIVKEIHLYLGLCPTKKSIRANTENENVGEIFTETKVVIT